MKKFSILITAAMVLIFIMPAFAGKPTPETNQTEIINTSENPVPITTNDQIEVIIANPNPVSITDESAKKSVISKYMEVLDTRTNYIIMTVPTDKEFILTDIVATPIAGGAAKEFDFSVKEHINAPPWEVTKIHLKSGYINLTSGIFVTSGYINLTSGIPFSPGVDVVIFSEMFSGFGGLYITITGYLLDHLVQ